MKSTVFWDVTPYNLVKVYERIGGTNYHLKDRKLRQAINHQEPSIKLLVALHNSLQS
jgi:hypothetical protein